MTLLDAVNTLAPSSSTLPTSVGVAVVFGYLLDLVKRLKQVPKVNYYSTRLNTILRIVLSGVGTLGVTWVWSAQGTGHQLLITIPSAALLATGIWHWVVQYGMQHSFEGVLQNMRYITAQAQQNGTSPKV